MTKTIATALQTNLQGGGPTLAWFLKVTRPDGTVYAWTSHDRDLVAGGVTYLSAPGLQVASFVASSGLAVGNNELNAIENAAAFSRLDVLAGKWDGSLYEICQRNWASPDDGLIAWPYGRIGNITPGYGEFTVELRDYRQALQQDTTRIFQEQCQYDFGDAFCTLDVADFTVTGTLTAVTSQSVCSDTSRVEAADWFGYGKLTWTSGQNNGLTVKIRDFAAGQFTLAEPMKYTIEVGDTYSAVVGCRKRWIEDCRDKFDNVLNFGGDPAKPTADEIISPPSETALVIPPTTTPSTPPAIPTPGAFNAAARVVALDYTQTYDAGNVANLARFGLVIRGMNTHNATTVGATYVADLKAANPDLLFAGYIKFNELKSPQSSGEDFYAAYQAAIANGWFLKSQPAGTHVQSAPGNGCDEMNITAATPTNGSGQRWVQYYAEFIHDERFVHYTPDYAFFDNAWARARITADYPCTGTSNQSIAASAAAIVAGNTAAVTAIRAENSGIKVIANADNDLSAFDGVFDAAFNEGAVGRSYGTFATGGIAAVRTRCIAHIDNTIDGMAILGSYGESTDYKLHRFAFCMAAMFDSWHCGVDSTPTLTAVWLDEYAVALGARIDAMPSAAYANSVWACRFETGLILVNPTSSAKSIDPTTLGSYKHIDAAAYGNQDPTVNDGSTVSGSISLPAMSGLVLIDV